MSNQEQWIQAAFGPGRRLEPTDAEVVPVLVQMATQVGRDRPNTNGDWRRRMSYSSRTLVFVIATILLLATATIAAVVVLDDSPTEDTRPDTSTQPQHSGTAAGDGSAANTDGGIGGASDGDAPGGAGAPGRSNGAQTPSSPPGAELGNQGQRRASRAAVVGFYDDLKVAAAEFYAQANADVRQGLASARDDETLGTICDSMTSAAQRQAAEYGRLSNGVLEVKDWNCQMGVSLMLRRAAQVGEIEKVTRARVVGTNVNGDRGTVSVQPGGERPVVTTMPLLKEDGEWKVAPTLFGSAGNSAIAPAP